MRIKSYFAPSVQAAIAVARKEFGDNVTLVTSHMTSLDNRHLGEYEVVFAIEEPVKEEPAAVEPPAAAPAFNDILQQAIAEPAPMHQDLPDKLEHIHTALVALGLEASLVRAFMTMLKAALPVETVSAEIPAEKTVETAQVAMAEEPVMEAAPEPMPEPVMQLEPPVQAPPVLPFLSLFASPVPQPRFSAAELAFMSCVSSPKEQAN